jgi:predicted transcriptional regulator of viral defense system
MYIDHMTLVHKLRDYASPRARITRMIRSGEVIQVRRGIFLDAKEDYSLKSLASVIYGPSYISFEYALAHYGLIPERVNILTSAVYSKNKNRVFHTPVGDFYYYYLPAAVYPYGVVRQEENNQSYLIASQEKALCDSLYKIKGVASLKALKSLLFDDWRMERERIAAMDRESISFIAPLYRKKILMLFSEWLDKEAHA